VARSEARLKALAANSRARPDATVDVLPADLNDKSTWQSGARLRQGSQHSPCSSTRGYRALRAGRSDVDEMEDIHRSHITAPQRLVYAAAPANSWRAAQAPSSICSVVGIAAEALTACTARPRSGKAPAGHGKTCRVDRHDGRKTWSMQRSPARPGRLVTLPSLQDGEEWTRFGAARRALRCARQFAARAAASGPFQCQGRSARRPPTVTQRRTVERMAAAAQTLLRTSELCGAIDAVSAVYCPHE